MRVNPPAVQKLGFDSHRPFLLESISIVAEERIRKNKAPQVNRGGKTPDLGDSEIFSLVIHIYYGSIFLPAERCLMWRFLSI